MWLAVRRRTGGGGARRAVDMVLGGAAVVLCGWLGLHTGWIGLAAIVVILLVGACLDRGLWRAARRVLSGA